MNSAPGKSLDARPDWPTASSAASMARRSDSMGAQKGSTSTVVDGAGDRGAQALGREALDAVDAGLAGRQRRPGVVLALAEGGDHAHAGDGDERAALFVAKRHAVLLKPW